MQLVKYDIETAVITALDTKYKGVEITDGKSYAFVMEGLRDYRELRLKIDSRHKELKADALEYGRAVDAEKNRLKGLLAPGEDHLKEVRQAEDDRKAAIKEEKERVERARIADIQEKIFAFQKVAGQLIDKSSAELQQLISDAMDVVVDESFMEFTEEARKAKADVISAIEDAYDTREKWEREVEAQKVEGERLAKERAEQEEKEKALAEERRKIDEEKAKLEREAFERQVKENAKIQAEKDAKEKAEREEKDRIVREQAEAMETARLEALRPDKEKLLGFAQGLLNIEKPTVQDGRAKVILAYALDGLSQVSKRLKTEVEDL